MSFRKIYIFNLNLIYKCLETGQSKYKNSTWINDRWVLQLDGVFSFCLPSKIVSPLRL